MTVVASVRRAKLYGQQRRYEVEAVVSGIPLYGVLAGLVHVTFYARAAGAVSRVMGVLGKRIVKHSLRSILAVARKAEGVVLAGFYRERRVSAAVCIVARKATKPLAIHLAPDKSIALHAILVSITVRPHLIRILSRRLGVNPILLQIVAGRIPDRPGISFKFTLGRPAAHVALKADHICPLMTEIRRIDDVRFLFTFQMKIARTVT